MSLAACSLKILSHLCPPIPCPNPVSDWSRPQLGVVLLWMFERVQRRRRPEIGRLEMF